MLECAHFTWNVSSLRPGTPVRGEREWSRWCDTESALPGFVASSLPGVGGSALPVCSTTRVEGSAHPVIRVSSTDSVDGVRSTESNSIACAADRNFSVSALSSCPVGEAGQRLRRLAGAGSELPRQCGGRLETLVNAVGLRVFVPDLAHVPRVLTYFGDVKTSSKFNVFCICYRWVLLLWTLLPGLLGGRGHVR